MKEAAEIEVILASLSNMAAQERENLRYNLENLVELDFIFARAALAMDMNATRPIFNTKGYINIRKGRHPLIDKKGSNDSGTIHAKRLYLHGLVYRQHITDRVYRKYAE